MFATSFLPTSEVMVPTDFIWNHERRGQQSLSWSETTRLSVGLRVQVRQRVAGDGPRTDQNNDGKGVKRAEVPPAENIPGCPGGCFSAVCVPWSSVCVSGSWSCACLLSVPVLGAGWWSRVPWPLPVVGCCPCLPGSGFCAGFREKGRRPKNRSRRSFARVGLFQVFPGILAVLECRYRGRILTLVRMVGYSPSSHLRRFMKASPRALNLPAGAGGRASTCRAGSPWRFQVPLPSVLFCRPAPLRSFWNSYYLGRAQQDKVIVRDILGTLPVLGCRFLGLVSS